jgi:hypothetical protein
MSSTSSPAGPPRIAAWSVELFASPHEADGILGDLAEDFQAVVAIDGKAEARRRYRRQAIQTIRDLALSPWQRHTTSGVGFRASSIAISLGIGIGGLALTWPVAWAIDFVARALVLNYPVYQYIAASLFWMAFSLLGPLTSGLVVALAARAVGLRSMSVALPIIVVVALLLVFDRVIALSLYGQPEAKWAQITVLSTLLRVGYALLTFGVPLLVGAAIGRTLRLPSRGPRAA